MALANFLGKSALSASQVLKNFDYESFRAILLSHRICVCFDKKTAYSAEGFATIDLLVRLLARLYPNLQLRCVDGRSNELDFFNELATSINPFIDLGIAEPTAVVCVGDSHVNFNCLKIFIGSDRWIAKFSRTKPQLSGNSLNRFGAGAAACFASANLFRHVFNKQLPGGDMDEDFYYSTFSGGIDQEADQGPGIKGVNLGDTVLVGLGAIGNAAIWSVKDLKLEGNLGLIDGERVDLSNLQRYVLTTQDDIGKQKVNLASKFLNQPMIQAHPIHFAEYLATRGNWKIFRVAVCVDSAEDRRLIQGSLPRRIINAWTGQEQCGISRHYDFLNEPCLSCLYQPKREEKSLPIKIAESLGFTDPQHIILIRNYMANQLPVDIPIIQLIAQIKGINSKALLPYAGKPLQQFYSEVICGGVMMQLTGSVQQQTVEVPAAFESAMAGILLAAELIIDSGGLHRNKLKIIHKLNLLRPLTKYTNDSVHKSYAPDCICHDSAYRDEYAKKWEVKEKVKGTGGQVVEGYGCVENEENFTEKHIVTN